MCRFHLEHSAELKCLLEAHLLGIPVPRERRKRGRPRETWMVGVQAAMTTRNLEPDQWKKREDWRLVSGRRRQLFKKKRIDR